MLVNCLGVKKIHAEKTNRKIRKISKFSVIMIFGHGASREFSRSLFATIFPQRGKIRREDLYLSIVVIQLPR